MQVPMVAPFCGTAFGGWLYDAFLYGGESPVHSMPLVDLKKLLFFSKKQREEAVWLVYSWCKMTLCVRKFVLISIDVIIIHIIRNHKIGTYQEENKMLPKRQIHPLFQVNYVCMYVCMNVVIYFHGS